MQRWGVGVLSAMLMLTLLQVGCQPSPPALAEPAAQQLAATTAVAAPAEPASTATVWPTASLAVPPSPTALPPITVNPLTGLSAENSEIFNRRPVLVKVENLPRIHRPPYGLNLADLVYEYVTEEGTTRFAALYYGHTPEQIGPVRSGRWFDVELIHMYKPIFVYGSAYQKLTDFLMDQDFASRLILEGPNTAPALYRFNPQVHNTLMLNMVDLADILQRYQIDNARQPLDGMAFDATPPEGLPPVETIFVRFSGAIYNRWDYDAGRQVYLRHVDVENDLSGRNEIYTAHQDALTGEQIFSDNVVVLVARYVEVDGPNIYTIELHGSGTAYLFRDGIVQAVRWQRETEDSVLSLVDEAGNQVAFKPGKTWFEVINVGSLVSQPDDSTYRFTFYID